MTKQESLAQFLKLLGENKTLSAKHLNEVQTAVDSAINDPDGYFHKHKSDFENRGISEAREDLFQFVLLNGLIEAKLVAEIDWKTEWEDVAWNIENISGEKNFDEPANTEETEASLKAISKQLQDRHKYLVRWEMDSDSYVVFVVEEKSLENIMELGNAFGITVSSL